MLLLSRLVGVFPLRKTRKNFELSAFWFAYSLAAVCTQSAYSLHRVNRDWGKPTLKLYQSVLLAAHFLITNAVVYSGLADVLRHRHQIDRFYRNISRARRILEEINGRKTLHRARSQAAPCLLVISLVHLAAVYALIIFVRNKQLTPVTLLDAFLSMSCHLGVMGCALAFSTLVGMIEGELQHLNEIQLEASRNPGTRQHMLLMADVHYLLSTTAEDLNSCFCRSYFVIISGSVLSVTSSISLVTYHIWATKNYLESAISIVWAGFWFFLILSIVIPCSSATYFSKKFNYELSLVIIQGSSKEVSGYDKEKLQLHVSFDFTVCFHCGFFELDRTLIHAIVGSVTSFAVILTQVAILPTKLTLSVRHLMLRFSKCFGSFPFRVKLGVLSVSWAWLAYSLILLIMWECLEIRKVYLGIGNTDSKWNKYTKFVRTANFSYRCFVYPFCLVNTILSRNDVSLYMRTMANVCSVLSGIPIEKDEPKNVLGFCLLLNYICILLLNQYLKFDVPEALKLGIFHLFLVGCVLQFNAFVLEIVGCLSALNRALKDFEKNHRNSELGPKLLLMSDVHYQLTTASRQLDNGYRRTYFALVIGIVGALVSTGYQVAVYIFIENSLAGPFVMWVGNALGLLWWSFWLIFAYATVHPCSVAQSESVKFNLQLLHLLTHSDSWGFRFQNEQHKRLLTLHSRYNFTVKFSCGFFDLNNSLIPSVLGGVVTLVVIVIQLT